MRAEVFARFGEREVRERVGDPSFERGEAYFQAGALFDLRREGRVLKARCEGSGAEVYLLCVAFDVRGIAEARCTCPVGEAGRCKHVAALLLAWARAPGEFVPVEPLEEALARCDRDELLALVRELVALEPEAEATLQTLLAPPAPPPTFRALAGAAFRARGEEAHEGDAAAIASALAVTVVRPGEAALRAGEPARAVEAFGAAIHAVLGRYTRIEDPGGALRALVDGCVERLADALVALGPGGDAAAREAALEALFAVLRADVERRMVGAAERVAQTMARGAGEDRRALALRVRRAMERSEEWARRRYERLRVDLEGDALSDEAYLALCRATGRTADLLRRLIELSRDDEAAREAEFASDDELARLGRSADGSGLEARVGRVLAARAAAAPMPRTLEWLRAFCTARGDEAGALAYAEQLFRAAPDLAGYTALRERAERAGQWSQLGPSLRAFVAERGGLLAVEVAMHERDVTAAVRAAQGELGRAPAAHAARLRVAEAAEAAQPREAIALYKLAIEALVRARGRANYREALRLARKVRGLYARLGEGATFAQYEAELRAKYGDLPAFNEEFAASHAPPAE